MGAAFQFRRWRSLLLGERTWWIVPVTLICLLQVWVLAAFRSHHRELIVENLLDFSLSMIAAYTALQASRRSHGLPKYLWRTASMCSAVFGVGLLMGIGGELWPGQTTMITLADEISVFWLAPLSVLLFLEADFEPERFDPIHFLDFAQLVLFWTAIYFFFLFLPRHVLPDMDAKHAWLQAFWEGSLVYDVSLLMLFALRTSLTSSWDVRRFFGRFSVFLAIGCAADFIANYNRLPSGTWFQLVWTALNIAPIFLAASWFQDARKPAKPVKPETSLFSDRLFPIVTAFLILIFSMVIMRERLVFAVLMVSISFACSSLRIIVIQRREMKIAGDLQAEVVERTRAEQKLRENEEHLEEQVARRTTELQSANTQLRTEIGERHKLEEQLRHTQKMEAIGTLSGGIAHDFNNLLTVIRGYSRMVLDRVENDPALSADVKQIDNAGARAAALTSQLLAFSRRQMLQPKKLNLNVLVRDVEKMLRRLIGEHIVLVTRADEQLGCVEADPGQMEQVIMNLVLNARDAMPRGGKLILETSNVKLDGSHARDLEVAPGDYVMLAVHDTGTGIEDSVKPHIFEPFFTTKERSRGTGLGLSTVYGIVKQTGGGIFFETAKDKGTTFRIYLSRVAGKLEKNDPANATGKVRQGSETILLVEDDTQVRQLTLHILERYGYTVLVAECGSEALQLCSKYSEPIDLLLTDVVMPGLSGPEVAQKVVDMRPTTKVLYMSGYTDDQLGFHGVLEEGITLLQKPFTPSALGETIRQVLGKTEPATSAVHA